MNRGPSLIFPRILAKDPNEKDLCDLCGQEKSARLGTLEGVSLDHLDLAFHPGCHEIVRTNVEKLLNGLRRVKGAKPKDFAGNRRGGA